MRDNGTASADECLRMDATAAWCDAILRQCLDMLESVDPATYATPCPEFFGGTIGQHVRHSLDHLTAAVSATPGATIDYDHRERGTDVENDPRSARREAFAACERLERLGSDDISGLVYVRAMLNAEGEEAVVQSTLGRELAFAAHHAVHHHAMIAAIAGRLGARLPTDFGKAPSTRNYETQQRRTRPQ